MSVLYFLALVGGLVAVHELGHFLAAKLLDVKVLRFSLGFGPPLLRLRAGETEIQVGLVPLGGYVRLLGEHPGDRIEETERDRAFSEKALWKRLVVVFAGPAANLVLPVFVYFAFFAGDRELPAPVVGTVLDGSPAAAARLEPGDRVLEVSGTRVRYFHDLERIVEASPGRTLRLRLRRGQQERVAYVTPARRFHLTRDGRRVERGFLGVLQAPLAPVVGVIAPHSAAARAGLRTGDVIVGLGGEPIASWQELDRRLRAAPDRTQVAYLRPRPARVGFADLRLYEPALADLVPETVVDEEGRRRVETGIASAETFVAAVEPGSPAARSGLTPGDRILSVDGERLTHWLALQERLEAEPDRAFVLEWEHYGEGGRLERRRAELRQERRVIQDEFGHAQEVVVFGASPASRRGRGEKVPIEGRLAYAASHALERTGLTIVEMVRGLSALLSGEAPKDAVGGPLMVYRLASVSAAKGWDAFLLMVAPISVNLGLLNLLPIPIFDGGHLVMFALEGFRRRRLSPRAREAVVTAGLVLIVSLTVLALRNDLVRYFSSREVPREGSAHAP